MNANCFSDSYSDAREAFLRAAKERGANLRHEEHPHKGPSGEKLFVDIARVGSLESRNACVLISGTHGVEGFCGSASQTAWLKSGSDPRDTQVYLVHALNPYGFAWSRRVTEDNVDLNRNCIQFDPGPLPDNPGYAELDSVLNPRSLDEASRTTLNPELAKQMSSPEKVRSFKATVGKGQYKFPKGIIYGGQQPTWSNRVLRGFIDSLPRTIRSGCVIDVHTGLGNSGDLQILTEETSFKLDRLKKWFQGFAVVSVGDPVAVGYRIEGSIYQAFTKQDSDSAWHCAALEFGTRPLPEVLLALQADNWLHCFAPADTYLAHPIRKQMRSAFTESNDEWQRGVVDRILRAMTAAIQGLDEGLKDI